MEPSSIDREIIHVDELIRIWKGHYIIDNVVQDQDKAKHYELLPDGRWHVDIKNAEIAGTDDHPDLKIAGLENLLGITFSNCIFKKNFHLRRCHITGWLAFHDVLFEESIDIHTSIIDEDWIIARCRIDSYCNITGDDFRQIRIEDSVFSTFWASSIVVKSDVNFLRTILSGEWLLKDITVGEDFSIINCLQQGKLELYNLQAGLGMNIYSVVITQSLSIIGPGKINGQSFIKQLGVNDITIEAVEFKETLVIEDVCIRRRLQFKDSGLKKVRILGKATSINEIAFEQRTVQTTDIWSVEHIYRIVFDKSILHKESVISFNQCRVKEVAFNSFLNLGNLAFVELEPVHIQFELSMALPDTLRQVVQNIEWQYAEIPLSMPQESKFSIINSDLGKAQFINCGLVTYERFEFVSSRLVDVFLAGTIMPENVQVPLNGPIVYDVQNEQRISYGQLKKNAELRGDAVGAMHFHFKELQAYRKWLAKKGKNRWGERFSLWLNEQSNRHGTNWGRAAAITFLLVVFLYTATCWAYGYRLGNNMSLFFELMSNMPEFLNPIRRTNIFTEISSKPADGNLPLARVIDYLSRFILAYFVYQTIQAFRKYGKKG